MKNKVIISIIVFFFVFLQGRSIVMADHNIQMGQRNTDNTDWDNHYPITKASNVKMADGTNLESYLQDQIGTKGSITYYVDNVGGSDTNDGLSNVSAYKTIKRCLDKIPKLAHGIITIRIKTGDYRNEGTISINNFTSCYLKLVAWDGTQEISTPKSGLVLSGITAYYNQFLDLYGIEVVNPNTSGYGIFLENCNRVRIVGYTNNDSTITTNSGVGITQGSNVFMDNCLIANKSFAVTCNFGAHVTTKNWHSESVNNNLGYSLQGGATGSLFDDTLPNANTMFYQIEGGFIVDSSGNKIFEKKAQQVYVNRNADLTTDWVIPISLSYKPSTITAISVVTGTKVAGNSQYVNGKTFSVSTDSDGLNTVSYDFIYLKTSSGSSVKYTIKEITKDRIVLSCTHSGTPTGNVGISLIVQT